ncbi:MAG: phosphate ABC transporter ATP-binding protein PstB [Actinomycetota bacterium]
MEIKNLNLYYGDQRVLEGINLSIKERYITAIIGPSGCGKTSLLRCLNRMHELIPNTKVEGEVFLDGENIFRPSTDIINLRKRIGMVFQRPNPFPKSIYDNVAYGPRVHGIKHKTKLDEIVERSLKRAALWKEVKDKLHSSALTLSGGQQQRLCIARVLAIDPEVVLMDEPCSALDPASTQRIEYLMEELKKKYTVVIVTHNMQQAARVSDFTAFLLVEQEGQAAKLIEYGKTDDIFTNPSDKRTENYITGRFG